MQFCCHNLASLLESKSLETVDHDVLKDLSTFYQTSFRCVDNRRLTPLDGGPTTDDIETRFFELELSVEDVFRSVILRKWLFDFRLNAIKYFDQGT